MNTKVKLRYLVSNIMKKKSELNKMNKNSLIQKTNNKDLAAIQKYKQNNIKNQN